MGKGVAAAERFKGDSSFVHLDGDGSSSIFAWINCTDKSANEPSRSMPLRRTAAIERQMPIITPNPDGRFGAGGELRQRIDRALAQLSHEHRSVLFLHEFEELEYKEIAKRMKCSIGTVMSRLCYARRSVAAGGTKTGRIWNESGGIESSGMA